MIVCQLPLTQWSVADSCTVVGVYNSFCSLGNTIETMLNKTLPTYEKASIDFRFQQYRLGLQKG